MKYFLLAALMATPCFVHAQTTIPFVIKGKLGPQPAAAKVYLVRGMSVIDSVTLKNGAFELKGATDAPGMADLILRRNG